MNPIKKISIIYICLLLTFLCFGDDDIKRLVVEDAELLCRNNVSEVDTVSFSSIGYTSAASGTNFLNRLDRIFKAIRSKNISLANETRLYLGCKLPREMKETLYQVVSEHYAPQFSRGDYLISSSGQEYAHKLIGRGFFLEMDRVLLTHGFQIKSVFLEKVVVDRREKQAFAFTDITLIRRSVRDGCGSVLLSSLGKIMFEEKDNSTVDSCVVKFWAEVFLLDDCLQKEIQDRLVLDCHDEMSEDLKSAENIHNPKSSFLYAALKPAIRDSPSAKTLSGIARAYGYETTIHCLGGEKLQFRQEDLSGMKFENPKKRIYGVWGFSTRKSGWETKPNLKARIVEVDAKGDVLSDETKVIDRNQYWF